MRRIILPLAVAIALGTAGPALADWDPGDGHKMHYPQLPDEDGWDVKAIDGICLADDWLCTESGPVTDIHFWGSWKNGIVGRIDGL